MKFLDKPWAEDEPREWLFGWCLATVGGTLLGAWLGKHLVIAFFDRTFYPIAAIDGLVRGTFIGFGQWWLLRGRLSDTGWWILLSALGLGIAGLVQHLLVPISRLSGFFELISLTLQGGLVGVIQWSYLNSKSTVAKWWIASCACAAFLQYLLSSLVGLLDPPASILDSLTALIWSAVGGITMLVLLDNLSKESVEPKSPLLGSLRSEPNVRPNLSPLAAGQQSTRAAKPTQPTPPVLSTTVPKHIQTAPSNSLELCNQIVTMLATQEAHTTAAVFDFELLKRPRRARLQMVYSGITKDTQERFRQHVQLNGTVLKELIPRSQNPYEAKEYLLRIPETLFERSNRLIVVSRSKGTPQSANPFRLHSMKIDFDYGAGS